jgi:hypothetical protein
VYKALFIELTNYLNNFKSNPFKIPLLRINQSSFITEEFYLYHIHSNTMGNHLLKNKKRAT